MKGNHISTQILVWTNHQVHNCRKKVQNSILGCSVQCRGDVVLWFYAFRRESQSPGALLTQWQDCLEWEQLLPHMLVAELCCSNLGGQGLWLMIFFSLLLHFGDGLEGSEELTVTEHEPQCAELQELLGAQKMEQDSCHGNPPANSSFQVWSQVTLYMSGRKHILWGQLGTKLELQNAFWRSLSSLQEDMEDPSGSLSLPRKASYCHSPPCALSPSLLHWWEQLNEELKWKLQEKASRIMWLCLDFPH